MKGRREGKEMEKGSRKKRGNIGNVEERIKERERGKLIEIWRN